MQYKFRYIDVNMRPHNSDVLKRKFIFNVSVIWNNIPNDTRMATNVPCSSTFLNNKLLICAN